MRWRQCLLAAGIFIWLGVSGPDYYTNIGQDIIVDDAGNALDEQELTDLMEQLFYEGGEVGITYQSKLLEWLRKGVM